MGPLSLAAALALALAQPAALDAEPPAAEAVAASPRVEHWRPYIREASERFGVSEAWIAAVMQAESGGRTTLNGRPITSHAGAMGLMQVMPGTWAELRREHGFGPDPHNPRDNIMAGAAYLKAMHDRFGYPGLFAAYNAGPGRYAEHLRTGRPLPAETRAYIAQLARTPADAAMPPAILSGTRLFFTVSNGSGPLPDESETTPAGDLFFPLRDREPGDR
ncbi:lytic transglycosylase domain-containing protein [Brevundimonas abyssalis]|uniref:Soluble lytic murein transglycosylase and related regulatory proteins n=1 Tax=Brevundimonas abyssalis TAR-001 TaxID=1391729 RepID=A0A8E0TSQ1_9CAUL|nr:lytic transglycosylase domain-containing protein [Brevundimonas abyssalis]GAD60504.1 soluble lytic murein transglycosylase and related regulatory proteins [Brevundimonas abyssalis TAR-001]